MIGVATPLMQTIETFGTYSSEEELYAFKDKLINTSVRGIIDTLDLCKANLQPDQCLRPFWQGRLALGANRLSLI